MHVSEISLDGADVGARVGHDSSEVAEMLGLIGVKVEEQELFESRHWRADAEHQASRCLAHHGHLGLAAGQP